MLMDVVRPVYIREQPTLNGKLVGNGLGVGDQIEIKPDVKVEADGYTWRQHADTGYWSAEQKANANLYLLAVLTPDSASVQTTQMKAVNKVNIRADHSTNSADDGGLALDDVVEVFPRERFIGENYVWLRHGQNRWSAQVRLSDGKVYLERVLQGSTTDLTDIKTDTSDKIDSDDTESAETVNYVLMDVVRLVEVRAGAGLATDMVQTFEAGSQIKVKPDLSVTVDDYIWRQHLDTGNWSPEKKVDGGIFLLEVIQPDSDSVETATMKATTKLNLRADHTTASADVGDVGADDIVTVYPKDRYIGPNYVWLRNEANQWIAQVVIASGAVYLERVPLTVLNGTSSTDLKLASEYGPGFRSLFQKLPVSMDDMKWFYYFGNTVIAYKCRDKYNYGYAQGLHGGVDLGNKTSATIIAGVNGVVDLIETKSDSNRKVWVKTDNYYIIYQHVWNEKVSVGQTVTPDTPIAEVRPWSNGGLDHLHLEVRNSSKGKILNPLWMMPEAMCNAIIKKYPATGSAAFLQKFGKYLTPLDQPIITNVLAKPENYLVPVGFLNQAELDAIKYSC